MSTFTDLSKNIVCDFLHNVVLADDRIEFHTEALPSAIVSPTRENIIEAKTESEVKISERAINVKPIIDEFMAKGIPCSFLSLDNSLQPEIYIKNLKKSDALILDWQVKSDEGEFILQILEKLFEDDRNSLKVILIYTGLPDLKSIIQKILEKFPEIQFLINATHGCSIKYDSTLISVYAKTALSVDPELTHRVCDEKQLVEALVDEFTSMTSGLISNVALSSISTIRNNTFKILSVFKKDIDPAFLGHQALTENKDDPKDLMIKILNSTIEEILFGTSVKKLLDESIVNTWIEENIQEKEFDLEVIDELRQTTISLGKIQRDKEFAKRLISNYKTAFVGISAYDNLSKQDKSKVKEYFEKNSTKYFCNDLNDDVDMQFALLTHHKYNLSLKDEPALSLGTVVKEGSKNVYWVCIQQRCDSERIYEDRRFLFLPFKIVIGENSFEYITPDGIRLKILNNTYLLRTIIFKPNPDSHRIKATLDTDGKYSFESKYSTLEKPDRYYWIFELKEFHAQRIANNYAAQLSRVGLDESEWLRRS